MTLQQSLKAIFKIQLLHGYIVPEQAFLYKVCPLKTFHIWPLTTVTKTTWSRERLCESLSKIAPPLHILSHSTKKMKRQSNQCGCTFAASLQVEIKTTNKTRTDGIILWIRYAFEWAPMVLFDVWTVIYSNKYSVSLKALVHFPHVKSWSHAHAYIHVSMRCRPLQIQGNNKMYVQTITAMQQLLPLLPTLVIKYLSSISYHIFYGTFCTLLLQCNFRQYESVVKHCDFWQLDKPTNEKHIEGRTDNYLEKLLTSPPTLNKHTGHMTHIIICSNRMYGGRCLLKLHSFGIRR